MRAPAAKTRSSGALVEIDGCRRADLQAGPAGFALEGAAGFRGNAGGLGDGLGEGHPDGFGLGEPQIIRVRDFPGTDPDALAAPRAPVLLHVPGPAAQQDPEVSGFTP